MKHKLDFENTEIAFAGRSNEELLRMRWLFSLMNKSWLVRLGQVVAIPAIRLGLPFAKSIIHSTIFRQFCGGKTLLDSLPVIEHQYRYGVGSILDYGAEGKERDEDFNRAMNETVRALEFAAGHEGIRAVSTKITGMSYFSLLEKLSTANPALDTREEHEWESLRKRLDVVCSKAAEVGVSLYIDAEESWIQPAIDALVDKMMARYNKQDVYIFNTFQMYRHDRLDFLKKSHQKAKEGGYRLGAKLVRGAYMDKERLRARQMGHPSPIHADKAGTDAAYDQALLYCLDHLGEISVVNATHNAKSSLLMAEKMQEKGIDASHPGIHFSQLYGMSDPITYNLANAGYRVSKYVPYGQIEDVIPYLIRRTQENTSVTGDMGRELTYIQKEVRRRKL
jgi:proline dehydrogenase